MRETLYIFYFCLVTRHWAENTPNSIITLIIELAMRNIIAVQEFPNIPLCPVNNGRKKYLVFTSDTGNHSFFMVAPLVESPGKGRFPLSSGFKFISATPFFSISLHSVTAFPRPQCKRSGLFQPHSPDIPPVSLPHIPDKAHIWRGIPLPASGSPSHMAASP